MQLTLNLLISFIFTKKTIMSITNKLLLIVTFALSSQLFSQQSGIVSTNGLLKVNGNTIENESGQPFKVAGNSIFWSGFSSGIPFYSATNAPLVVDHLANQWNSGIIRAAMAVEEADDNIEGDITRQPNFADDLIPDPSAEGYFNNPADELEKIENIIDAAIANDIYVLVDFHSHFANFFETEAITFFEHIATKYGTDKHIIYEIFNEPISTENHRNSNENQVFSNSQLQQDTWNNIIKPYAVNVINAIRAIDPDNLIVVGTPGFSQFVNVAANNRITEADLNLPANADLNVAYTLHFYAGTHTQFLRDIAEEAMDIDNGGDGSNGVALFVTEWGTVNADGNGAVAIDETLLWMDFMRDNNLSNANWSVVDKDEGSAIVKAGAGVNGLLNDELTTSGFFVQCLIENFNANTSYANCGDSLPVPTCGDGGGVVPTGVGFKVEVETPASVGEFDACGARSDFRAAGLAVGDFQGQGILTGFSGGRSAVFSLETITSTTIETYTIQVVFSSNSDTNQLLLQRDSGMVNLGSINLPNTGGLNNYQIINITGVPFSDAAKDIAINVIGDGPVNVESFYYVVDGTPALDIEGFNTVSQNQISLYPVPSQSFLNVGVSSSNSSTIEYSIFDLKGKIIKSKTELVNNRIDVQNLESGVYILSIDIDGQQQNLRFVKN